jgi:O-antigen ligase
MRPTGPYRHELGATLTTAILAAGLLMIAALAAVMVRPSLRLPALAFGLLAIPGNVDDLLPQMVLDPHDIADRVAPVVGFLDLLLVWGLLLTVREGRRPTAGHARLVGVAFVLAAVATITIVVNAIGGVDPAASIRGTILFSRIVGLLYLAGALRHDLGNGRLLAAAIVLGGVVLLANGIYTTTTGDLDRFTAKTFGRNGFAIALTVVTVVGAALAFDLWSRAGDLRSRLAALASGAVAGSCLYGLLASGTRMAFVVLLIIGVATLVLYPGHIGFRQVRGIAVTVVLAILVTAGSVAFTFAGARTVSVITDPDNTVDVVTNPGDLPTETEIRSRGQFWTLAVDMARADPLTGVGPFQWNVVRYQLDPGGPVVVADAHESYLQIAAEYGLVTMAVYLVLLLGAAFYFASTIWSRATRARLGWSAFGLILASGVIPIAALTNAHIINPRNGPLEWLLLGCGIAFVSLRHEVRADEVEPAQAPPVGAISSPGE